MGAAFSQFPGCGYNSFSLLSVAYYAFFAPFLGRDIYEYVAFGVYSVLAFSVFILYVRCTAIDPSDPRILLDADKTSRHTSQFNGEVPELNKTGLQVEGMSSQNDSNRCPGLGCFFCGFLVREDYRSNEDILQQ